MRLVGPSRGCILALSLLVVVVCLVTTTAATGLFPSIENAARDKPVSVTSSCGFDGDINSFCDPTDDGVTAANACNGQAAMVCNATCPYGSAAPQQYDLLDPDTISYFEDVTFRPNSIELGATSQLLILSSSAAFPPASSAATGLTLAARIRTTQQQRTCVVSKSASGSPVFSLCLRGADNVLEFTAGSDVTSFNHTGSGPVVDGAWHHIAVIVLQDQARFYIDGLLAGTESATFPSDVNSGSIVVGQGFSAADVFIGELGGVYVYARAVEIYDICTLAGTSPCQQPTPDDGCRCPASHPITADDNANQCVATFAASGPRVQRTNIFSYGASAAVDSSAATYWRSGRNDSPVNVTLDLQGLYEFMRLEVSFVSDRPHSMVVERSADGGSTFSAYRYVSRDCPSAFGLPTLSPNDAASPDQVICTLMPDGPGAVDFILFEQGNLPEYLPADLADVLFPFSQVTHVRFHITQLAGTYDEQPGDPALRDSYVAISDVTVTARVLCNGHADSTRIAERNRRPFEICDMCAHNTQGDQCGQCAPLFNNAPFARGTGFETNACDMCECNGHASACAFNATLNTGICSDCDSQTAGDNCDTCDVGYYRAAGVSADATNPCQPCSHCNANGVDPSIVCVPDPIQGDAGTCACVSPYIGSTCTACIDTFFFNASTSTCQACACDDDGASEARTCDAQGVCTCKAGYTGDKCDACADGFYRSAASGLCVACACNTAGTEQGTAVCDKATGQCPCTSTHTSRDCGECVDSYYLLPNQTCAACSCFADGSVSSSCDSDGVCMCVQGGDYVGDKCDVCRPGLTANIIRQCADATGDVMFVVDVSEGVSETMLQAVRQFLSNTISALGVGETATRVGVVQYASGAAIASDLNDHFTVAELQQVVSNLALTDTAPLLGGALNVARSVLRSSVQGGRTTAPDTVVVVTATTSEDSVNTAASILEAEGVNVIVVGVGAGISLSQLQAVVSDADNLHLTANATLLAAVDLDLELTSALCNSLQELQIGCRACDCDARGTVVNTVCDAATGQCVCKDRTTGARCDRCKDGYAGLTAEYALACSGLPSAVNSTEVSLAGDQAVLVSWTAPTDPNGIVEQYTVRRNGLVVIKVDGNVYTYRDEDLQPGDTYTYTVAATTPAGEGPESALVLIRIPDTQPEGLAAPSVTEVTPFELSVSWSPPSSPNGIIVGYTLLVNGARTSVGISTSHTLAVYAFTTYSIAVEACNSEACAVSNATSITTSPAGVQGQGAPTLTATSPRALSISWSPPTALNGDLQNYRVELQQVPGGDVAVVFTGTDTETTVSGLLPFTTYRARVTTSNVQTTESATSPWTNTTLPPAAPEGVAPPSLVRLQARTAIVRLAPPAQPNGITESYTLVLNGTDVDTAQAAGNRTLSSLLPYTTYSLVVRVCTEDAGCTTSSALVFTTVEDVPEGLTAPTVAALSPTRVRVTWSRPTQPNGEITRYDVQRVHTPMDGSSPETTTTTTITEGLGAASLEIEDDVSPYERYTYSIIAFTSAGSAASDPTSITTPEAVPTGLAPPVVSDIAFTSAIVSWSAPTSPNGALVQYHLLLREEGDTTDEIVAEGLGTNASLTLLTPYTGYRVRVRFVNSVGVVTSDFTDFETLQAAPDGFSPPQVVSTTSSSLTIQWPAPATPNGVIARYIVHVDARTIETAPTLRQVTVTDLLPNQVYSVFVEACTEAACTSSASITGTTDKRAPAEPEAPQATPLDPTTILVRWAAPSSPNQPLTHYELYRNGFVVFTGLNTTFTDEGLTPGTSYAYAVVAYNDAGGSTSPSTVAETPEDTPAGIAPPTLSALSSTSISATWTSPSVPNGIVISYALIDLDTSETVCTGDAALRSCVVSELSIYTLYTFQVQACTASGCGLSADASVRTNAAPPVGLALPSLSAVNATSVSVSWMPPTSPNGPVVAYQLWVAAHFVQTPSGMSMSLPSNGSSTTTMTSTATTTAAQTTTASTMGGTTTPVVSTQSGPTMLNLLDPGNVNGTAVQNADGSWTFADDAFLQLLSHGMRITSRFSIAFDMQQTPGNSGYYLAKSDALGRRFFSLYNTATSQQLYFVYRVPGATDIRFTRFTTNLNDGNRHKVLVSVNGQSITVTVDGSVVGTNTLDAEVDDCGAASDDCIFFMGQKASLTGDTLNFDGTMFAAALFPDSALTEFPQLEIVQPGGDVVSTSSTTTTTTTTTPAPQTTTSPAPSTPVAATPASALDLPAYLVYEGLDTTRVVTGVRPYSQFIAFVRVINTAGSVDSSLRATITPQDAPGRVSAPNATAISASAALIEWSAPEFANGIITQYQIRVRAAGNQGRGSAVFTGFAFSHIATNLDPATSYEAQLIVSTSAGSTASAWTAFTTREALPTGLADPVLSDIQATSARVSWSPPSSPNGEITRYLLLVDGTTVFNGNTLETTLSSLSPGTSYDVQLQACNTLGCTSSTATLYTRETAPGGLATPIIASVQARAITLAWQPPTSPNGQVSYVVQRRELTGDENSPTPLATQNITEPTTDTSLVDTNVSPFTQYEYRIAAFTTGGTTLSGWVAVRTSEAAPEGIAPPTVIATAPRSLAVTFAPPATPNGVVTSMRIVVSAASGTVLTVDATGTRSLNITDSDALSAYTTYDVALEACTDAGCSTSQPSQVATPEDDPVDLAQPVVTTINSSAFQINWLPPSQPNGIITTYILIIGRVTGPPAIVSLNGDVLSYVFADPAFVQPYTVYQFLLQACNSISCVTSLSVDARSGEVPPSGLASPTLVALSNGDVSVSWAPPENANGQITEYIVFQQQGSSSLARRRRAAGNSTVPVSSTATAATTVTTPPGAGGSTSSTPPLDPISSTSTTTAQMSPVTSSSSTATTAAPTTPLSSMPLPSTVPAAATTGAGPIASSSAPAASTSTSTSLPPATTVQQTVRMAGVSAADVPLPLVEQVYLDALDAKAQEVTAELKDSNSTLLRRRRRRRRATQEGEAVLVVVTATVPRLDDVSDAVQAMQHVVWSGTLLTALQFADPATFRDATITVAQDAAAVADSTTPATGTSAPASTTSTIAATTTTTTTSATTEEPVIVYRGLDTQVIVSGLLFNTEYTFVVAASNGAGSVFSDPTSVHTVDGPPSGVAAPTVAQDTPTSVRVVISAPDMPNGDGVSYSVLVDGSASADASEAGEVVVNGLQPFTTYTVAVQACTTGGCTTSSAVSIRTLSDAPADLDAPSVTATSSSSLVVTWMAPGKPNGMLLDYKVWLRELEQCSIAEYREENGYVVQSEAGLPTRDNDGLSCRFVTCPLGLSACGLTCYDPFNEACCDGQVHDRQSGHECCGTNYVASDGSGDTTCCGGQLVPTRAGFGCCASRYVSMGADQVCCEGQVQTGNECCGDIGFVNTPEQPRICCGGQVFDSFSNRQCCGGSIVSSQLVCCGGLDTGIAHDPMEEFACCGTDYVHGPTSTCCGEGADAQAFTYGTAEEKSQDSRTCCANDLIAQSQECCNGRAYDPTTETCADRTSSSSSTIRECSAGTVCSGAGSDGAVCGSCDFDNTQQSCFAVDVTQALADAAQHPDRTLVVPPQEESQCMYVLCGLDESVCGATCFGPDEVCCSGKVYQRDSSRRCCGTSYLPRTSGDVCCGNALYPSQPGHACCGSRYVDIPDGSVCCDGLVLDGDSCCGAEGYYAVDVGDSMKCCGGQLLETTSGIQQSCCGSGLIVSGEVCCEGVSYEQQDGYACCGSAYVREDSSLCCKAADGAIVVHDYSSASAKALAGEVCCGTSAIPSHLGCCNGEPFDETEYVCADRSSGSRSSCAAGRLCPVSQADSAYCDSCSFDTAASVCGVAVGVPFTPECSATPSLAYAGPGFTATVNDLKEDTRYEAQVEAATIGGVARSGWTPASTLSGELPAPRLLVLGNSSILVSWDDAPTEFGVVQRYELYRDGTVLVFSGLSTVFEDTGLVPGTMHTYEYVAVSELTTTRSRTANATTFTSVPAGFSAPTCTALGATSVQVQWTEPLQPNGIILQYILQRGDSPDTRTNVQLSLAEVVQGLEPATAYTFRVFACTETGCKGSPPCSATTDEAAPTGMRAPTTELAGGTQLTVQWLPPLQPNGVITSYLVQTRPVAAGASVTFTTAATLDPSMSTSLEASVILLSNVEYAIRVVAVNSAGNATSPAVLEPKPPVSVSAPVVVPPVLANEVTLAWAEVTTFVSYYAVVLKEASAPDSAYTLAHIGTEARATINNLQAGRTYSAVVVAGNAAGNTSSSATTFTTAAQVLPPEQFAQPTATATSSTSAVITWTAPLVPNGEILEYRLLRSGPFDADQDYDAATTDPASAGELIHQGLGRFVTDESLQPYSRYFYAVLAVNAGGATRGTSSSDSSVDHAVLTTLATLASGLSPPSLQPNNEALLASWVAPERLNGELGAYVLEGREVQEPALQPVVLYEGENTWFNVTGLKVFTTYQLRVNVRNSVGTAVGPWASATTCGGTPLGVAQPSVTSRSPTAIQLTWPAPTALNGVLVSYNLMRDGQIAAQVQTRSFLVENLTPYTEYTFAVETCVRDPCDNEELCATGPALTTRSGEGLPTGLAAPTLEVLGASSIHVSWSPPSSANGVIQQYQVLRGEVVVYTGIALEYMDTSLEPNVMYTYRVRATNGFGSVTSAQRAAMTLIGTPANISAPVVTVQSDTSALVCWSPPGTPNGVITNYIIVLDGEDLPQGLAECAPLSGLTANTEYSVQIKACTNQGCGISPVTTFVTRCTTPASNSPDTITPGTTKVTLSWTPPTQPSCAVLRYIVFYGRDETDPSTISVVDVGTNTSVTIGGLLPYTRYSFQLQVSNERGSVKGAWVATRTLEGIPRDVPAPGFIIRSATQLIVVWNVTSVPGGPITEHVLYQDGARVGTFQTPLYEADDLTPFQEYTFQVETCTVSGCTRSEEAMIRMPEAAPEGQGQPAVDNVLARSFHVAWSPPLNPYGIVTAYQVYVRACELASSCTSQAQLMATVNGTATDTTITGLTPYTIYQVQVSASNSQGVAASSFTTITVADGQPQLLRTKEDVPEVVGPLTCTVDAQLEVACNWDQAFEANGILLEFEVTVRDRSRNDDIVSSDFVAADKRDFSFFGRATTYLVEVTAVNSVGVATATQVVVAAPSTTTTTTTAVNSTVVPVAASGSDLTAGGIAGVAAAGGVLLLLIIIVLVQRSTRSRVHEMSTVPTEDKGKQFWQVEEELVELRPKERARPLVSPRQRATHYFYENPHARPDSRTWRDEYSESEADSYSLGGPGAPGQPMGGYPLRRRTSSLHGLLHNQHVQVVGQRQLDTPRSMQSEGPAESPHPASSRGAGAHGAWTIPPADMAPQHQHQHQQRNPYQQQHQQQPPPPPQFQSSPPPPPANDDFADLRAMLQEQQRVMQQYAARSLEQANMSLHSQSPSSSSQQQQHPQYQQQQHPHRDVSFNDAGVAPTHPDSGYLQIAPVPASHVDEPDTMEMRQVNQDAVSRADSEAPLVFTEAPTTLDYTQHEEDTWL
ncbi:laminin alpha 5 chain [Salpingoeca rosetta]|uniref:Laminin alpha 5 chain n=1 Tax=Salpingoeca rosetta (strain ATCC 50818 / BSB-021) TaxID=946362 RepID=F2U1K7_SALR5|nr:laminin alpha 5 chain [Salpingoeca rosetta]EGD81509.1 laminin alpha 5 chain [Salpingoeca rosetta]|eukprot:XP_004996713.1 laminin alpha 5 chain [Salpingoeca rosetta]